MKIIYLLALAWVTLTADFILHRHQDSSAKCLDGSPAALYYQVGVQSDKFVIFFEGGGLCRGDGLADMIQYCYKRSFTNLGSSSNYPDSRSFNTMSFLSTDTSNPFREWTRVFVPYCDGSVHQGSRSSPINYKDRDLYFRGSNNTLAHFAFLDQQFNLFSAKNIIITGTSAGGLAAFVWSNFVYERAQHPEGVLIVPDSGQFIVDFPNIYNNKTMSDYTVQTFKLVNSQTKMPLTACIQKYPSQVECFQAGNLFEFIKPKMFVLQSQYDSWGLIQILQFKCVPNTTPANLSKCSDTQMAYIQKYRSKINEAVDNLTSVAHIGAWSISCVQHGFLDSYSFFGSINYKIPGVWGPTIKQALLTFMAGGQKLYIDTVDWPFNNGCCGLRPNQMFNYLSRQE